MPSVGSVCLGSLVAVPHQGGKNCYHVQCTFAGGPQFPVGSGVGALFGSTNLSGGADVNVAIEAGNPLRLSSINEIHIHVYSAWNSIRHS